MPGRISAALRGM